MRSLLTRLFAQQVEFLTKELGFDAAYNYKTVKNQLDVLEKLCPEGIDM